MRMWKTGSGYKKKVSFDKWATVNDNTTTRFLALSLEHSPTLQAYSFNQIYDRFLTIMTLIFTTFTSRQLQRIHLGVLRII